MINGYVRKDRLSEIKLLSEILQQSKKRPLQYDGADREGGEKKQ